MKIQIEVNEERILELAKTASMDELPKSIFYEAKRQAVQQAVDEIKNKLVEKSYYSDKESLYNEVKDEIYKRLDAAIKKFVEDKFNEKSIQQRVEYHIDAVFKNWVEKKIYEQLNQAKADINFYSEKELREERENEANQNQ